MESIEHHAVTLGQLLHRSVEETWLDSDWRDVQETLRVKPESILLVRGLRGDVRWLIDPSIAQHIHEPGNMVRDQAKILISPILAEPNVSVTHAISAMKEESKERWFLVRGENRTLGVVTPQAILSTYYFGLERHSNIAGLYGLPDKVTTTPPKWRCQGMQVHQFGPPLANRKRDSFGQAICDYDGTELVLVI
jgi:hypothetical protein